jgi:preprotein translocase subunit SecE
LLVVGFILTIAFFSKKACCVAAHLHYAIFKNGYNNRKMDKKLMLYLRESYNELLKNVSWPTAQQLQESTVVVLVTSAMLALLIFGMDALCSLVFKTIYGIWK